MEQSNNILVAVLRAAQQTGIIPVDYTFTALEVLEAAQQAGIISSPPANDTFPTLQGFECFVPEAQPTDWHMNDLDLEDLLGDGISNGIIDTFQEPRIRTQFVDPNTLAFGPDIFQAPYLPPNTLFSGQASVQMDTAPTAASLHQGSGRYMDSSAQQSSGFLPDLAPPSNVLGQESLATSRMDQLVVASKAPSLSTNSYWLQDSSMEPYVRSNKGPVVITSAINFEAFCVENGYRHLLATYPRGQLRGPEQCTALCYFQWSNARGFMVESLGYTGGLNLRRYKIQYNNGSGRFEDLLTILEHQLGWNITTFQSVTRYFEDCERLAVNYVWDPELNPVSSNYTQSGIVKLEKGNLYDKAMWGIVKSLSGQPTIPDVDTVDKAVAAGSNAQLALRVGIHLGVPSTDESAEHIMRLRTFGDRHHDQSDLVAQSSNLLVLHNSEMYE
ncbi:hypothetical protein C8J55DRAFT_562609 [Lentinula edodes]|uniref:Uncharacterized protein n=1 Tax=Lentinula lateritia TaxID=40482 RepID=A0A9W9A5C3_9AGAR|nr:hypothetical protein C8J55DRAFT_562609 [Lentinula edodes]